jgi:GNAT superfamily N-acetyltransferase
MERLSIRTLVAADHDAWLPLWQGYQRFYRTEIAPEVTARTWARLLDPAEPMHVLGAEHDGRLIGITHYLFHRSSWTVGDYCYLQDLFVDEAARGLGAGRALIEAVSAAAKTAGASRVYWLTAEDNPARALYDKVARYSGFIQYRR